VTEAESYHRHRRMVAGATVILTVAGVLARVPSVSK